tara:strand:- start:913 stop:1308 length:396 start_codon:yes stop_codon:yes gene_type:complete
MTYETREIIRARRELDKLNSIPLQQKKEAKQKFFSDLTSSPSLIVERISWLLDGNYGFGHYLICKDWLTRSKRFNVNARLFQSIAALEYQCPLRQANQVYNMLTSEQQKQLNLMITTLIQQHKEESEEETA